MKKKKFLTLTIAFAMCFIMTSCGKSTTAKGIELTDEQKTEFFSLAETAISALNEERTEDIREMSNDELNEALTDEKFAEIYEQLGAFGEFVEFAEAEITSTVSNGVSYIVVFKQAKYAEKTLLYTLSYTEDKKLAGIYYK